MTKQTNVELKQSDNIDNIRSVQSAKYENVLESLEMRFGDQLIEPVRAVNYSDGTEYNMGEMDFTIQMNQEIPSLQKRLEKVLKFIQMTEDSIKRIDAQIGGKTYSSQDLFQQNMEIQAKQRQALEDFGGTRDVIATLCGLDPNEALDNLADRLRDQCGDAITEEQIQNQLDSFQQRIGDTIDTLSKPLAQGGMDNVLQDSFQKVIQETVPKDEPGNLVIAEDIIAGMFNPMYVFYTKDLMKPMQLNRNAGFLNLVLANKNGVPQRGQISNYKAAKAFATTLLSGFFPFAADAISEDVGDDLEEKFFGGMGLSLKPARVGYFLKNQLEALDITINERTISMGYIPAVPLMTTDIFNITYNFNNGQFDLIYPIPFPGRLPVRAIGGSGIATYEDLLNNGSIVSQIQSTVTSFTDPTATNMGAGLIAYNSHLFAPTLAAPLAGPTDEEFEDAKGLVNRMRIALLNETKNTMLSNERAFAYGSYNLEQLTDDMFLSTGDGIPLTPAPAGYVLQRVENATPDVNDDSYIVTPPPKGGWLEFKDNLLPETSDDFCCPTKRELFDVKTIVDGAVESFKNADKTNERTYNDC